VKKDEIKAALAKLAQEKLDRPIETVPTPEWEVAGLPTMDVRAMSGTSRDAWDQVKTRLLRPRDADGNELQPDYRGWRSEFLALHFVDEDGELLGLSDLQIRQLGELSGAALERCFDVAERLSKVGAHEEQAVKN
jgi:hypothetical protein